MRRVSTAEAQAVALAAGLAVESNAPLAGVETAGATPRPGHQLMLDLGADAVSTRTAPP